MNTLAVITGVDAAMKNHCYSFDKTLAKTERWRCHRKPPDRRHRQIGDGMKEFNKLAATTTPEPVLVDDTDTLYLDE